MAARPGRPGVGRPRKFFAEAGDGLLAFARHQFALERRGKDGYTARQHYESAAQQGSISAKLALQGPELPEIARHVWEWFCALSAGRSGGGFGLGPITWPDLEAWARVTATRLRPHELQWLRALDLAFLAAHSSKEEGHAGTEDRGAA